MARLHRSGPDLLRVLLVGGEALAAGDSGAGLLAAEELADLLQASRRAGVDLDVLWELRAALEAMSSVSEPWRVWPYDAVVFLLPALPQTSSGSREVRDGLLATVVKQLQSFTQFAVVAPSPRLGSYVLQQSLSTSDRINVVGLPGGVPLPVAISSVFTKLIPAGPSGEGSAWRVREQDESARHHALDRTHALQTPLDRGLARVVTAARDSFGLDGVMVNLLDAERLWTVAALGAPVGRQPRHGTLCDLTIRTAGITVFEDTWSIEQFDENPIMHGPIPLRFYAGHPIESSDGYRIGTLCVYDREPHDRAEFDFSILRDLALLAEGEVLDAKRTP